MPIGLNEETFFKRQLKRIKERLVSFLLFSLLIHTLLLFLVLAVKFAPKTRSLVEELSKYWSKEESTTKKQQRQELLATLQTLRPKQDMPAKLTAARSKFGWVMFSDAPQPQTLEIPTTMDGEVGATPTPFATETEPTADNSPTPPASNQAQQANQEVMAQAKQLSEQIQQFTTQEAVALNQSEQHNQPDTKTETPPAQLPPAPPNKFVGHAPEEACEHNAPPDKSLNQQHLQVAKQPATQEQALEKRQTKQNNAQRIKAIEQLQAKLDNLAASKQQTNEVRKTVLRGAQSEEPKPKKNIIALTKGFVENIKSDGADLLDRDGDPNKRPSLEELKYFSYESKINWCLQAAWKQNFASKLMTEASEGKAVIEFTIDAQGNVASSNLLSSSGNQKLDSVIMKNLLLAQPFPPLPKHFQTNSYTTGRVIHVYPNKLGF
ncbi:MAG: TonB family protein [Epsilonproteobacteria bacterium]|nr:TonB family protein [Campylobacterota bacterium]